MKNVVTKFSIRLQKNDYGSSRPINKCILRENNVRKEESQISKYVVK